MCCLVLGLAVDGYPQQQDESPGFPGRVKEIKEYSELVSQIKEEKQSSIGYEAKALQKQLIVTKQAYRNLLWQFTDDLLDPETQDKGVYKQFAVAELLTQSTDIKNEMSESIVATTKLEEQILTAKKSTFIVNKAVAKERISDLNWKLYLARVHYESLCSALVNNVKRVKEFSQDVNADENLAKTSIRKQADMLSGLIGINRDKLLRLEKELSVIRNESDSGRKLISAIAIKKLEINAYASRLQAMVMLLADLDVDTSLYKKTVIQSSNTLTVDLFDKRVASHLFTEWWLSTKKWYATQAPSIMSKAMTFIGILVISWIIAVVLKKTVRGLFSRTRPDMSELAKRFIISMTSRVVILVGLLIALSNMGIQIGPILAGLGIMGFIIGFALQETLSNFASGLMMLIYRPFDVGHKIRVSGMEGKVKDLNLVSTTIVTSANHRLTIPNNKVWKDVIHNITSQPQVRLDLYFIAPFNADSEKVLLAIKDEIKENPIIIQERESQARIYDLGRTEVKYIARFWIASEDIDEAKWLVFEGVKKRFDEQGVSSDIIESLKFEG